nr:hypothetical protein [Muribaculaceae bacterium]
GGGVRAGYCLTLRSALRVGVTTRGGRANFGWIARAGWGIYVEAWDHGYEVFDLKDAGEGVMVRSNYSYSGGKDGRLGEVRHDNAVALLEEPVAGRSVTPLTLTEGLSRSFYNARLGRDMLSGDERWIEDRGEMIPRWSSCASVVIEGGVTGEMPVMWVAIGFPVLAETVKVTMDGDVPEGLLPSGKGHRSALCDRAVRMRDRVMPRKGKNGKRLFDARLLRELLDYNGSEE